MSTIHTVSIGAVHEENLKEAKAFSTSTDHQKQQLDAGALFVLKSKGSWWHSGYHLTTSIVAPSLLSLPFAFASLGWWLGVLSLVIGAAVTFYSYNLISLVLEHHADLGHRHLRFRDMAYHILGPGWSRVDTMWAQSSSWYAMVQWWVYAFGRSMPQGNIRAMESKRNDEEYTSSWSFRDLVHQAIQVCLCVRDTCAPVKGKMFKGLCVCYTVITFTFFSVAVSGYWAFGNESAGLILRATLLTMMVTHWFQMVHHHDQYLDYAPTLSCCSNPTSSEFSARNVIPRVISRSISVILAITVAAMLPFFGDINAMIGAFGFLPLDFVLPVVLFNLTFKPSKKSPLFWLNSSIAVIIFSSGSYRQAAVAAVRQNKSRRQDL
ncbi:hypothetical protein E3N88_41533 [Mikania micrantha]|uniref:Amino acid transporter transmembrane domain-containing protein n=1 Tax=Mikania micrantha TaxID=192012 RepID=A0A5N6LKE5_9ASTR|nr:hypothetical protein E3N88_41533 [Mikania micrantha]